MTSVNCSVVTGETFPTRSVARNLTTCGPSAVPLVARSVANAKWPSESKATGWNGPESTWASSRATPVPSSITRPANVGLWISVPTGAAVIWITGGAVSRRAGDGRDPHRVEDDAVGAVVVEANSSVVVDASAKKVPEKRVYFMELGVDRACTIPRFSSVPMPLTGPWHRPSGGTIRVVAIDELELVDLPGYGREGLFDCRPTRRSGRACASPGGRPVGLNIHGPGGNPP